MIGVIVLTFRELMAKKILLGLFIVATLVWGMLALSLQLEVVDGALQGLRFFGQSSPPLDVEASGEGFEEMQDPLRFLVVTAEAFAAGAAYWVGILLALFATGGLVASMMDQGQVDLLLSKPISRSRILAGRLIGVGAVTAALCVYMLGMVWLVMSLKSGIWNPRFLLAMGIVFTMFAVVYGIVTLISVWTGSSPLALIGTLGLLFVTLILAIPGLTRAVDPPWDGLVEGLHAVLPRFPHVGGTILPMLALGRPVETWVPLAASLVFGAAMYAAAFWLFSRKDF